MKKSNVIKCSMNSKCLLGTVLCFAFSLTSFGQVEDRSAEFKPAPELTAEQIEAAVNEKKPYTLYRKGSVAEYAFMKKGKQKGWAGVGPAYLQQIVDDAKAVNGVYAAYIRQEVLNKAGQPAKVTKAAKEILDMLYAVEIDTAGSYHLTHNPYYEYYPIIERTGYGIYIPSQMAEGLMLQSSTIADVAKNGLGGRNNVKHVYSDWTVVGVEDLETPAGTFECVKIQGKITVDSKGAMSPVFLFGGDITLWLARGVGIVRLEESEKGKEPFVMYLNRLMIK